MMFKRFYESKLFDTDIYAINTSISIILKGIR